MNLYKYDKLLSDAMCVVSKNDRFLNIEKIKKSRDSQIKFRQNNTEKHIYFRAKSSSKRNHIDFNIEVSDIVIPEKCPLLGVKLTKSFGLGRIKHNPSIDRIDSSKGYIKGNIWVISDKANTMKSNATLAELIIFSKNVIKLEKSGKLSY
jgi:hypothetical protein